MYLEIFFLIIYFFLMGGLRNKVEEIALKIVVKDRHSM